MDQTPLRMAVMQLLGKAAEHTARERKPVTPCVLVKYGTAITVLNCEGIIDSPHTSDALRLAFTYLQASEVGYLWSADVESFGEVLAEVANDRGQHQTFAMSHATGEVTDGAGSGIDWFTPPDDPDEAAFSLASKIVSKLQGPHHPGPAFVKRMRAADETGLRGTSALQPNLH